MAALRRQAGLSQEAFADEYGLHRTYLSGVERGCAIRPSWCWRIAKALKVPPSRLLDPPAKGGGRT